jgi:hypothetical protein
MKRSLPIVTALLILLGSATSAHATIQQIRVMAAGVDRSASTAQELAIEYAKKRAVYLMARKLPIDKVADKVQAFTPKQYGEIIRGYEVVRVRREKEITYAEVNVSIVSEALRRALNLEAGAPNAADASMTPQSVLVLPVFVKDSRPYLWEEDNALRIPLTNELMRQSHGTVTIPGGDPQDLRLIDYQNALSVTGEEMKPMFDRYGAQEIIIAIMTMGADDKRADTSLLLRRLTLKPQPAQVVKLSMPQTVMTDEALTMAAARTIAAAATQIASATSESEQKRLAAATKLAVHFSYANPRELARMQSVLRTGPGVLMVELPSIGLGEIDGYAYVEGDKEKLRESLKKQGILVSEFGNGWKLSLR